MTPVRGMYVLLAAALILLPACDDDDGCVSSNPFMPVCPDTSGDARMEEPGVVFVSNREANDLEIYTMNSDGTGARRLTFNPGNDIMPAWSPDGTRIVFASVRAGAGRELYTMNADGSDQRRLTSLGTAPGFPHWSPDGTRIAFHAARGNGDFDIYVMNADGSGVRRLTSTGSGLRPRWSPDGQRLVFSWFQTSVAGTCCSRIAIINADGSDLRVLPSRGLQDGDPEWSPDGRQLAFGRHVAATGGMMGYNLLGIINDDGTGERLLGMNTMGASTVTWSRTTGRIFFASSQTGWVQVYSVLPDGLDFRRVGDIGIVNNTNPNVR
jgi:Tol biopolymer transport system component